MIRLFAVRDWRRSKSILFEQFRRDSAAGPRAFAVRPFCAVEWRGDFYEFFGKAYDPFNLQIHRLEIYEQTGDGLRPLYQAGDRIESRVGAAV